MKLLIAGLIALCTACTSITTDSKDETVALLQSPSEEVACGIRRGDNEVNEELANLVYEKVKSLLMIANEKMDGFYFEYPTISFDIPSNVLAAGYYDSNTRTLLINPLFLNKHGKKFIEEVVTHEVAHLITRDLGSREANPHGQDWHQVMMKVFEVERPLTTHDYGICP